MLDDDNELDADSSLQCQSQVMNERNLVLNSATYPFTLYSYVFEHGLQLSRLVELFTKNAHILRFRVLCYDTFKIC